VFLDRAKVAAGYTTDGSIPNRAKSFADGNASIQARARP
jgi:hypothetical protein